MNNDKLIIDKIKKLSLKKGDILIIPNSISIEEINALVKNYKTPFSVPIIRVEIDDISKIDLICLNELEMIVDEIREYKQGNINDINSKNN